MALNACNCKQSQVAPGGDGIVRLQRQVKGRGGKPVVAITGLPLNSDDLKALARKLKNKCGVGGTVEDSTILIQGDKRPELQAELVALGYQVKISGG
jgi:translation initiation factor 1